MIALIDYGMGNLLSVRKALEHVGGQDVALAASAEALAAADAVVLPGVGNFGDGAKHLRERGLDKPIADAFQAGKPFLGICLGMQLLMESSEEAPGVAGLGLVKGSVKRFPSLPGLKIPQIGWNSVDFKKSVPCVQGLSSGEYFYFVHSFYIAPDAPELAVGVTDYGINFCSCVGADNWFATQFHPEKSQDAGLLILRNFVNSIPGKRSCS